MTNELKSGKYNFWKFAVGFRYRSFQDMSEANIPAMDLRQHDNRLKKIETDHPSPQKLPPVSENTRLYPMKNH